MASELLWAEIGLIFWKVMRSHWTTATIIEIQTPRGDIADCHLPVFNWDGQFVHSMIE
jgi:hypothetical protein